MKKITILFFIPFIMICYNKSYAQTVEFYQDNFIFSDQNLQQDITDNCYLGRVKLSFTSSPSTKYFNLSTLITGETDNWTIKNFPINSIEDYGSTEERYFPIKVSDRSQCGIDVTNILCGYTFTDNPITSQPQINSFCFVGDFTIILSNGVIDNREFDNFHLDQNDFPKFQGLETESSGFYGKTLPGYPVQDCGLAADFPASLSDGLFYISRFVQFPPNPGLITINEMKVYSNWQPAGVELEVNDVAINNIVNQNFFINGITNIYNNIRMYPVTPPAISPQVENMINLLNIQDAVFFIIESKWVNPLTNTVIKTNHTISIRDILEINSDLFAISFSYDAQQGIQGGTIVQEGYYIPSTNNLNWTRDGIYPLYLTDIGTYYIDKMDPPLPIELSSFTYSFENSNVNLFWTTASEKNNSGFEIERKNSDGKYSKIGFAKGQGESQNPVNYNYIDKNLTSGIYKYRLKQIDFNGNFEYYELSNEVSVKNPDKFSLSQNYPNPFNPTTNLEFGIPASRGESNLGFVSLKVYNIYGKEVANIVNSVLNPGIYKYEFNGNNLPSGVYFYTLTSGNFNSTKKMLLLK